jgi:hypothetical protein
VRISVTSSVEILPKPRSPTGISHSGKICANCLASRPEGFHSPEPLRYLSRSASSFHDKASHGSITVPVTTRSAIWRTLTPAALPLHSRRWIDDDPPFQAPGGLVNPTGLVSVVWWRLHAQLGCEGHRVRALYDAIRSEYNV